MAAVVYPWGLVCIILSKMLIIHSYTHGPVSIVQGIECVPLWQYGERQQ